MNNLTLLLALGFSAVSLHGATVTVLGGTAPTVDGDDIANLNTTVVGSHILNGDRGYAGLSFTTGSNVAGYTLNAVSFYQTRSTGSTGGRFRARLGTESGGDITTFYTDETADEANAFYTLSGSGNEWLQYTFTTPQTLAANTTYTIDLGRGDGGNYISWGYTATEDYTGGVSYRTNGTYNAGPSNPVVFEPASGDKIFHLDMTAVPEPSAFALLAGFFGLTWVMVRRRA